MEITNLGAAEGLPPVEWAAVVEKLEAGAAPAPDALNSRITWLCTVNEDGSPRAKAGTTVAAVIGLRRRRLTYRQVSELLDMGRTSSTRLFYMGYAIKH